MIRYLVLRRVRKSKRWQASSILHEDKEYAETQAKAANNSYGFDRGRVITIGFLDE